MEFKRSDLHYKDYTWEVTQGDDPDKRTLDRKFFNRHEGYEVLSLLNHMIKELKLSRKDDVTELEIFIREEMPDNVHGRENVIERLKTYHDRKQVNRFKRLLQGN
jgi:hypothetical protein